MANVLVIDDDPLLRAYLRHVLESEGHFVLEASDGAAGLALFRSQPADLVFCDVFMPDMDGLEVLRRLRRDAPETKVVAMSGGGFDRSMDLLPVARQLGATASLYKPFRPSDVLDAVQSALAVHAA